MKQPTDSSRNKEISFWLLSLLLGALSTADKHYDISYLAAPALLLSAGAFSLSPTAVLAGQAAALLLTGGKGAYLLPILVVLYLLMRFLKGNLSPGAMGGILCLYEILIYFITDRSGEELLLALSRGILSGNAAYFLLLLRDKSMEKNILIRLLSATVVLMLCDSVAYQGIFLTARALLIQLSADRLPMGKRIALSLTCLLAAPLGQQTQLVPYYLAGVMSAAFLPVTDRRIRLGAFVVCTEVTLLPYGIWRECPLAIAAPIGAAILYWRLSPPPPAPKKQEALPSRYDDLVREVERLQQSADQKITFHPKLAQRATELLRQAGAPQVSATCTKDALGGLYLDVELTLPDDNLSRSALLGLMERAVGVSLSIRRFYRRDRHISAAFIRKAPFKIECAALCKTKEGETVCGDTALAFGTDQFHYALLLSDGMGSGKDAFAQSCWTVTLLQKLLRAGIGAEGAMGMVHSTLKLAHQELSFATADLCTIDLWSGKASFIKAGAVSTFILREQQIIEVFGVSMPLGMTDQADLSAFQKQLQPNDLILMISDGAYDCKDETLYTLQKHRQMPVRELAGKLMESILSCPQVPEDDITVLLAKFVREKEYD